MAEEVSPTEIRFSRELDAMRATSRSLAILVGLAVFTLHGSIMAAGGPAAAVSYVLVGGVFLLTLLCYVELMLSTGQEGGAYILLREATRGPLAFLAGWVVLLGGLLLCVVLALGFAAVVTTTLEAYFGVRPPESLLAAVLVLVIVTYNGLGGGVSGVRVTLSRGGWWRPWCWFACYACLTFDWTISGPSPPKVPQGSRRLSRCC